MSITVDFATKPQFIKAITHICPCILRFPIKIINIPQKYKLETGTSSAICVDILTFRTMSILSILHCEIIAGKHINITKYS